MQGRLNLREAVGHGVTSTPSPLILARNPDILNGNLRNLVACGPSGWTRDFSRGATRRREGFERIGTQEKLNFYNIARASAGETRSLLYVIEDNYPEAATPCDSLRQQTSTVGRKITGLITSFRKRQAFITLGMLITLGTLTLSILSFS